MTGLWLRWRGLACGVALLAAWGVVKTPWERALAVERERLIAGRVRFDRTMRDQLGQGAALALLSGFRRVVADFLWIRAHGNWQRKEWTRMRGMLDLVCTLQPRSVEFWTTSAWHMAWNISFDAYVDPTEPSEAKRLQHQREWIDAGRLLLERGAANLPDRYELWFQLGWIHDQKYQDYLKAAEYFRKAATFPDAPPYITRLVGYRLERGGRKREAYEHWRKLWEDHPDRASSPLMLWDKVESEIRRLEKELSIPEGERLFQKGNASHAGA
jgi:tetratricopeptide (TPR) repeat protein